VANLSPTNNLHGSTNDMTGCTAQQQHSPHTNSMIRSPVKFDFSVPQNQTPLSVSPADIDQTIAEVIKGKGTIMIGNTSASTSLQQQQKQTSSPQLVWEQNGPVTTKTYLSPLHQKQQLPPNDSNVSPLPNQNVVNITQQLAVHPPILEQNAMDTLTQRQTINGGKKRNQPKPTNSTGPKRSRKTATSTSQLKTIPPVTSTSTLIRKPIPLSSSGYITTTDTSKGNVNHDLTNDLWKTPNIDYNHAMHNSSVPNDTREQLTNTHGTYDFELDDVFSPTTDERFNSSTPPPPLPLSSMSGPVTSQLLTPVSAGQSSTPCVTNLEHVYDDFFSTHMLYSSTWQENQVTSSVLTPPDFQNNSVLQQQHHSQIFEYMDPGLQPQVRLLSNVQSYC
jgi:hypothetical protein